MPLPRRIRSLLTTTPLELRIFAVSLLLTPFFRIALFVMPFRRVIAWQGAPCLESPDTPDPGSRAYREALHRALLLTARYEPGIATCHALCLTGRTLLRRRGLPSTLYIGFRKMDDGRYVGHAWLRSHDTWVTGGGQRHLYDVHSYYS
jgi:hypothetical protein